MNQTTTNCKHNKIEYDRDCREYVCLDCNCYFEPDQISQEDL